MIKQEPISNGEKDYIDPGLTALAIRLAIQTKETIRRCQCGFIFLGDNNLCDKCNGTIDRREAQDKAYIEAHKEEIRERQRNKRRKWSKRKSLGFVVERGCTRINGKTMQHIAL